MEKKLYLSSPLPFQGQKRDFAKEFIKVLDKYPNDTVFVDLFGGSGLLSHLAKYHKPESTVIYNDFDGFRKRLDAIPFTNALLNELRNIIDVPRRAPISGENREKVLSCIRKHECKYGYVDYITLSTSVLFSMKYANNYAELEKETLYNKIRITDYPLCPDYLSGIIIRSGDYKVIYEEYKDCPNVVFLVDPPYLSTDSKTYNMYWKMSDYLDVLTVLAGHRFVYFTSNKSSILELCQWIGKNRHIGNPFEHCHLLEFKTSMNYNASYTDMMLYTEAA